MNIALPLVADKKQAKKQGKNAQGIKAAKGNCVIRFWCNRGKHRSVGCAELFNAILSTEKWAMAMAGPEGAKVILEHISLDVHKHGCRHGCYDCQPKSPFFNPNLLGARAVWDRSEPAR